MINSLLSAGEIPGLYNSEELDAILGPIREDWRQENFRGTVLQYFARSMKYYYPIWSIYLIYTFFLRD